MNDKGKLYISDTPLLEIIKKYPSVAGLLFYKMMVIESNYESPDREETTFDKEF